MITDAILSFFLWIAQGFVNLIPPIPISFSEATMTSFASLIMNTRCVAPVDTLVTLMGFWVILQNIDFVVAVVNWVIRKIPGVD